MTASAYNMDVRFLNRLEWAREIAGIPFTITSGFRSKKHNKAVGGVPNSSHLTGLAVDIAAPNSRAKFKIMEALMRSGFCRIGMGQTFIHVDIDKGPDKPQDVLWPYPTSSPAGLTVKLSWFARLWMRILLLVGYLKK